MRTWKQALVGVCAVTAAAFAQPANDDCSGAIDLSAVTLPHTTPAVNIGTCFPQAEFGMCIAAGYSVWYTFRPASNIDLTFSACAGEAPGNLVVDTVIGIFASQDGTCDTLTLVECNDDACGRASEVQISMNAGTTYYIQLAQWEAATPLPGEDVIQMRVKLTPPPPPGRLVEVGDAGDLPGTSREAMGAGPLVEISGTISGADADMFEVQICEPSAFSATTVGNTGFDTQLFLFSADGRPVTFNDDSENTVQSTITGQFVPAAGVYLIAIAEYDNDPRDSIDQEFWIDRPFAVERAPDGPGAVNSIHHWDGDGGSGGRYLISLTGAAFLGGCGGGGGGCPACAADYNQDGGVDGSDVESFFTEWEAGSACADVNQDGGTDGGDVESFYTLWEAGDANCGG